MKLDLFKLNNHNRLDIDTLIDIPEEYYEKMGIRSVKEVYLNGDIKIDFQDEIVVNLEINGTFILPCAITLEDVEYQFSTKVEENIGKFEDFYDKNKNRLDILPIIWENIVSEVPIRVVKEGVNIQDINGEGWELVSND